MAAIVQDQFDDDDGNYMTMNAVDDWAAQTFTPTCVYNITKIAIKCFKSIGHDVGTITVELQGVDGAGDPNGSTLATTTIESADVPEDAANRDYVDAELASSYQVTSGTEYAVVVHGASLAPTANFSWSNGGAYATGTRNFSVDGGGTWSGPFTEDAGFKVYGVEKVDERTTKSYLVALGNDEVWYESTPGTMAELAAANGDIATVSPLTMVDAYAKLFIANKTNLKVLDFINTLISTADLGAGVSVAPDKGTVLTGGTSSAEMVVDFCTAVASAAAVYGYNTTANAFVSGETVTGTNGDGNAVSFTTAAGETTNPHWYDWTPFGNDTTTYGSMPSTAWLVTRYRGRVVLAGNDNYPHQYWMSRVGNPWDYLRDTEDALSPVVGSNTDAGEVGDIIRALIPYGDDYLVFGCANSIHLMTGDPAAGGRVDEISNEAGMWGPHAWCKDSTGDLYFFGPPGGVYKMAGGRSKPVPISQAVLPDLWNDWQLDTDDHRVVMLHDPDRQGILLVKVNTITGANEGYWFSLKTEKFYPVSFSTNGVPFSGCFYPADDYNYRGLMLGGNDGYIRYMNDSSTDDDDGAADTAISAYVGWVEPIGDGEDREGKLTSLTVELAGGQSAGDAGDSDEVAYQIYSADEYESCMERMIDGDDAVLSATLSGPGRKSRCRSKIRGAYLGLKFQSNVSSSTWALNKVTGETKPAGRIR